MKKTLIALLLLILSIFPVLALDVNFDNFVADEVNILSTQTKNSINAAALDLQKRTGADIAVIILDKKSLKYGELSDLTREIGRKYKIGSKDKNEGVIFALIPNGPYGNRVRIEVGYGLEGILNDGKCGRILDDYVMPYYENEQYEMATKKGVEAINQELNKYYQNPQAYEIENIIINSMDSFLSIVLGIIVFSFCVNFTYKLGKQAQPNKLPLQRAHNKENTDCNETSYSKEKHIDKVIKQDYLDLINKRDKYFQDFKENKTKSSFLQLLDTIIRLLLLSFCEMLIRLSNEQKKTSGSNFGIRFNDSSYSNTSSNSSRFGGGGGFGGGGAGR